MRAYIWVAGAALLLVAAGCGKKDDVVVSDAQGNKVSVSEGANGKSVTTFEGKDGKGTVTADDKGGTVTMESDKGSVKTGTGVNIPESDLGVPYYPGAEKVTGTSSNSGADGAMYSVTLSSTDAVDKVAAFYKGKMPGAESMTTDAGGKPMVMLMKKDGKSELTVHVGKDGEKTMIIIVHQVKK
jgi:hypothetical protein